MSYHVKSAFEAESLIKNTLAKHEGFVSPDCSIEVTISTVFLYAILTWILKDIQDIALKELLQDQLKTFSPPVASLHSSKGAKRRCKKSDEHAASTEYEAVRSNSPLLSSPLLYITLLQST